MRIDRRKADRGEIAGARRPEESKTGPKSPTLRTNREGWATPKTGTARLTHRVVEFVLARMSATPERTGGRERVGHPPLAMRL